VEELASFVEGHATAAGPNAALPKLPAAAVADMADARCHLGPVDEEPAPFAEARRVLLTGATGFLGAFVLRNLLTMLPHGRVVCLARGGETRLRQSLAQRELADKIDWTRVETVDGDLADGLLGLGSPKRFMEEARTVDAVLHSAAAVNWMMSYEALRPANVLPCFDLVRFCTTGRAKRLLHVSTVSCSPTRRSGDGKSTEHYEGWGEDDWAALSGPYAQSKHVAEKVLLACSPQLRVSILRPANIMADTQSGAANLTDFSDRYVHTALALGVAIDDAALSNFTPVDYVSRACVEIGLKGGGVGPFLISNNKSPSFALIADALVQVDPAVKRVSFLEFRKRLLEHPEPHTLQLFGLLPLFQPLRPFIYNTIDRCDCTNTLVLLQEDCPATTVEALLKWVAYLRRVKFIPANEADH
jgi:L-aminoadipate-semialdehyde dehydrogenase